MKIYVYYTVQLTGQGLEKTHLLVSGIELTFFTIHSSINPNESDLNIKNEMIGRTTGEKTDKCLYIWVRRNVTTIQKYKVKTLANLTI